LSWILGVALSVFSIGNLLILARTRRFGGYVAALLTSGLLFVPLASAVGGGITGTSTGLAWGFLAPAYAIMALGPQRATGWFLLFLAMVAVMLVADPFLRSAIGTPPYGLQLIGHTQNVVAPLAITFLLLRYTDIRRRRAEARADELLTNAIPGSIAKRLRQGEQRIAESYPDTTVVFADIVGFTPWAQRTDPTRVVELLDELFTRLDELASLHGMEKIKTVGDAYMAVVGAPEPREDHAAAALRFARAVVVAVETWSRAHELGLQVRVGLASGPVVAGIIGRTRILFDLWGDTVNTAARMESSGLPGRIQLAESTWRLVPHEGHFERRAIDVRGLGSMATYLVEGVR
jgi:guanylate cyclase